MIYKIFKICIRGDYCSKFEECTWPVFKNMEALFFNVLLMNKNIFVEQQTFNVVKCQIDNIQAEDSR